MTFTDQERAERLALLREAAALLEHEPAAAANLLTVAKELEADRRVVNLDFFIATAHMIVKGLG